MLTVFNRKQLLVTYSMKMQSKVCSILSENGIDYLIKTVNRGAPSPFAAGTRSRTGSFGESAELTYEYIIYVRKSDYERACVVIR